MPHPKPLSIPRMERGSGEAGVNEKGNSSYMKNGLGFIWMSGFLTIEI
jgi:hypothetical protein